jgi:hypothetical protein
VIAVKDSFNVVPIRVEDECGVVPGVIVRSQPGPSVVDPSRLDRCGVERINRLAVWRGERDVHRTGRHVPFPDPEVLIAEREAGPQRVFDDPDAEGLQRPFVERTTPCDVAYWQRHMIKEARRPTWHGPSISNQAAERPGYIEAVQAWRARLFRPRTRGADIVRTAALTTRDR